jgi:hypothetical protein
LKKTIAVKGTDFTCCGKTLDEGHSFSRAVNSLRLTALQAAENLAVFEGYGLQAVNKYR